MCYLAAYNDAVSSSLIAKDPEQLVPVVLAKAGYDRRAVERETQNGMTGELVSLPPLISLFDA